MELGGGDWMGTGRVCFGVWASRRVGVVPFQCLLVTPGINCAKASTSRRRRLILEIHAETHTPKQTLPPSSPKRSTCLVQAKAFFHPGQLELAVVGFQAVYRPLLILYGVAELTGFSAGRRQGIQREGIRPSA